MAYVLRLIAAALLSGFYFAASAQSCSNVSPLISPDDLGLELCYLGCEYKFLEFHNDTYEYMRTGKNCSVSDGNPNEEDGGGGGGNNNPPDNGGGNSGGGEGGNNNPPNSGDGGSNDGGSGSEENPGNGESPGDGSGGGGDNGGKKPGIPANAVFCDEDQNYLHGCFDEDGDYWHKGKYYNICDPGEDKKQWRDCYFDGLYYNRNSMDPYSSDDGSWSYTSPEHYLYAKCRGENILDVFHWDLTPYNNPTLVKRREVYSYKAQLDECCSNRYGISNESELYDQSVYNFKNNRNATEGLFGNEEIDISKKFGIVVHEDGSMSSTLEDILSYAKPTKSGKHGVCLDDIKIQIHNQEIVLEVSRVCEWLEYLGTILLFISYFVAFQIIARD